MTMLRCQSVLACGLLALASGALAAVYPLPPEGEDLVGEQASTAAKAGDTIATLAYRHSVGFRQVLYANPKVDPWNLRAGEEVQLPTQMLLPPGLREGIVINVPEMRLYYFPYEGKKVFVYPVAVGRVDWPTPLGTTQVQKKVRNPVWNVPESIRAEHAAQGDPLPARVPAGSPDNPLGLQALRLGWSQILIHGTNMPLGGIGMPVTHGCIRLYPQDIEALFNKVAVGTRVSVINEPYKLGRHQGRWYLEAHPMLKEDPHAPVEPDVGPTVVKMKASATGRRAVGALDWERVAAVLRKMDGVPTAVELQAGVVPTAAQLDSAVVPSVAVVPAANVPAPRPPTAEIAAAEARRGSVTEKAEGRSAVPLLALGALVVFGLIRRGRRLHR